VRVHLVCASLAIDQLGDPEGVVFIAGAVLNADKRSNFRLHYELSAGMLGIESLL
jgi:hypothetical protein